jgi:tellurite resistance protein
MAALANSALIYSGAVGGKGVEFIAGLLLLVLTVSILVLSIRTVHALATGRLLAA